MKLFKRAKHNSRVWYMVDDNTAMPIACDSLERAKQIINEEFDGEMWRLYIA